MTTLERAYELAASGECDGVGAIKKRLKAEGYEAIHHHLFGLSVTKALQDLCVKSGGAPTRHLGRKD